MVSVYVYVMYFQICYFQIAIDLVLSRGVCWGHSQRMDVSRGYGWW